MEVRKDGKKLEVLVSSGNVFFDVAKPLEDNESMNIRTSTMAVGIRGTSGWIEVLDRWTTRVSVLEGTVECSVADPVTGQMKAEPVSGGESVLCVVYPQEKAGDKAAILRDKYTVEDIPGFVLTDLTRDIPLCDKIEAETDLDIPRDLAFVAGGDPSGREPDGQHATPEVLGESDRREDEDEDALHEKLEEIEKELEKQPEYVSPSKPLEKPAPPVSPDRDDSSDSVGGSSGTSPPAPAPPAPPEPETCTITFSANGGAWSGAAERTVQTSPDGTVTLPEAPTRSGYSFSGWYDAPTGGTQIAAGSVFTADTAVYAQWLSTAFDWKWDEASKTLTFSGQAGIPAYSSTGSRPWNAYADRVENVVIKDGITSVGGRAFQDCPKLSSVTIPSSVTDIYSYSFKGCSSLTSVVIPEGVARIFSVAFLDRASLASVTVSSSVTEIGDSAFKSCTSLTSVIFSPGSRLTSIEAAAFSGCSGLQSVTIPEGVASIGQNAFYKCISLTSVTIPGSVTSLSNGAFQDCSGLTSVVVRDGVTFIGEKAFYNCSSLREIELPNSITKKPGANAFYGCNITSIHFRGTEAEWSGGARFYDTGLLLAKNPTVDFLTT